ncbi:MAG: serine/threonine protein kinase [Candidatus Obscuribacterales bacterium]|nr:serine/threonine protein kinase [Candidatus Obscuribacterales bacterium]
MKAIGQQKEERIVLRWHANSALAPLCQIISLTSILSVLTVFAVGVLKSLSGGPDWPLLIGLFSLSLLSAIAGKQLAYNKITMTKQRIEFSPAFCFSLIFKCKRKWTDIGAIALVEEDLDSAPEDDQERRLLHFHFSSGGFVRIPLAELTVADLDALFRGSKRWGSTAVMAPELIELRRKLVAGPSPSMNLSLTTLWEKELQAHFTTSTFVPLAAGTQLNHNRYRVISQIGAGGLSAIYLARAQNSKKVILKELVLHKSSESSMDKAKELFKRESSLLIKLDHPQIARVHDYFTENGRDYLVLDYIPGQSLRQLVDTEGPRLEDKVLEWANAIAGILQYLHSQSPPVIHRDLSPENLVLGEDGKIYLIDFGAANEFAANATGTLIGKQAYIAPEQFRGKPVPASDIYSLGATLYFLLTGQDPEAISESNPQTVNKSVSIEMGNFVAALTKLDLEQRPENCSLILQKIAELRATDRGAVISIREN